MRKVITAAIVVGLAGCQFFGGSPRPPLVGDGEDSLSGTNPSATKTPGPGTETPAPVTASTGSDPAASSAIGGNVTLPYKVVRFPMAAVDGVLYAPGGLFQEPTDNAGGEITDQVATASITTSGTTTTLSEFATASLPLRVCDQMMTVDHKGRLLMIGGVTQSGSPGAYSNRAIPDVYLGEIDASKKVSWKKLPGSTLEASLSAFALASSADGKTHYVAGGEGQGLTEDVLIGRSSDEGDVTWTKSPNFLPAGIRGAAAVVTNSRLYIIGGAVGNGDRQKDVLAASIWSDGSLGQFTQVATLPAARAYATAYLDKGNKIVVAGGNETSPTEGTVDTVFVGKFDSAGTLTFSATTPLAAKVQHYGLAVSAAGAIIAGGSRTGEFKDYVDTVLQIPFSN